MTDALIPQSSPADARPETEEAERLNAEMLDGKKRFAAMFQPDIQAMNAQAPVAVESDEPPEWYKEGRSPYQPQRDGSSPDFVDYPAVAQIEAGSGWARLEREVRAALRDASYDEGTREETLALLNRLQAHDAFGEALMERWRLLGAELLAHGAPRALVDQLGLPVEAWDLHATVEQSVELNRPVSALQPVEPNVVLNADWRVVPLRQVMQTQKALAEARSEIRRLTRLLEEQTP